MSTTFHTINTIGSHRLSRTTSEVAAFCCLIVPAPHASAGLADFLSSDPEAHAWVDSDDLRERCVPFGASRHHAKSDVKST
jgi:hypothetical protein